MVKKQMNEQKEHVNHPSHYTFGKIEVIDVIDDWDLTFCVGNTIKYIARAGKKDGSTLLQDLKKAVWYLQHEINHGSKHRHHITTIELKNVIADWQLSSCLNKVIESIYLQDLPKALEYLQQEIDSVPQNMNKKEMKPLPTK